MTAAIDIVRSLQSRGVEMAIEGEIIRLRGHGNPLTDAEREALSQCKGEVIAFLSSRDAQDSDDPKINPKETGNLPYGKSPGGRPLTYSGRVVSLDAWRRLSEWEKHGPAGKQWNGITKRWEEPT